MQASSPTGVCYKARFVISRLAVGPPWFVGEGFIPPAGVCAAARSGGMRASRPTVARVVEASPVGRASAMVCRGGPWLSRGSLLRRGVSGTISGLRAGPYGPVGLRNAPAGAVQASSPTLVCGIAGFVVSRLATAFCLPCQREVARPQAVTEGLSYGQMPFKRSGVTEKFFFFELRLPGTSASFYAIPRSPLSPPLTRGPNQPANVPAPQGPAG